MGSVPGTVCDVTVRKMMTTICNDTGSDDVDVVMVIMLMVMLLIMIILIMLIIKIIITILAITIVAFVIIKDYHSNCNSNICEFNM